MHIPSILLIAIVFLNVFACIDLSNAQSLRSLLGESLHFGNYQEEEPPTPLLTQQPSQLIDHSTIEQKPFGFTNLENIYQATITNDQINEKGFSQIIAIGDLHGDLNQTRNILQKTNIIDENDNWIAKKGTILIQTGDIFDRGDESVDILKLFWKLRQMASTNENNGLVLQILGNHEQMNLRRDYRMVAKKEIIRFGGYRNWDHLLSSNHAIGWFLRQLPMMRIIGDTLFVHAGLRFDLLTRFNFSISTMNQICYQQLNSAVDTMSEEQEVLLFTEDSPLYTRQFDPQGAQTEAWQERCDEVSTTLKALNLKRMVIGHVIQFDGIVKHECNQQLLVIDVGMSKAYSPYFGTQTRLAAIAIDLKNGLQDDTAVTIIN